LDYKDLLKKYIRYIIEQEGTAFIPICGNGDDELFTDEEWETLREISNCLFVG
jgi:hypothetical protein